MEPDLSCFVSIMNNTKWAEALWTLRDLRLMYRIKWLDIDEPTKWGNVWWESSTHIEGAFGPPERLSEMEWLEIDPVVRVQRGFLLPLEETDMTGEAERRLQAASVPFTHEDGFIRITGHQRIS